MRSTPESIIEKAKKRLAKGEDPDTVLEEFSTLYTKSLLHPILIAIKQQPEIDYEASRKRYDEQMASRKKPSDHVKE